MTQDTEFLGHPNIDGLTLFAAEPGPHDHKVHAHDAYSVIVLTSGAKHFHHLGETCQVNAHEIAIANPNEMHGCGPIDGADWSHLTWYLSETLMQEIAEGLGLDQNIRLQAPVIRDSDMANDLIAAHKASRDGELLDRQVSALEALGSLVSNYSNRSNVSTLKLKSKAADRLNIYESMFSENINRAVELKELSEQAGVKPNQVIKDFKKERGTTPGSYFRLLRLNNAKRLIQGGENLVNSSMESGFADQSHFTRCFKAAFGITPDRFRQLSLATDGKAPL